MINLGTPEKVIEMLLSTLPYPEHISDIDLKIKNRVYFTWRHERYKIHIDSGEVNLIEGIFETSSNATYVMGALIRRKYFDAYMEKREVQVEMKKLLQEAFDAGYRYSSSKHFNEPDFEQWYEKLRESKRG